MTATAITLVSCTPQKEVEAPPATEPVATPHPATGATETAIRLYPDLAKKDSLFNRTFREVYESKKGSSPSSLTKVDWPLRVAEETARILDVQPAGPATPTPRYVAPAPPARQPTALERGAYGEKRAVTGRAVRYDQYGNRYYY